MTGKGKSFFFFFKLSSGYFKMKGSKNCDFILYYCNFVMLWYISLLYGHRLDTRIFPVMKIWYPVKIQFLSFTCEDIAVVMAMSVSASRKRASQHLAISVYIINRILHACLWIQILSSRVQLDISLVCCADSWDIELDTGR